MHNNWIFKIDNLDEVLAEKLKSHPDMRLLYDILQQKNGTEAFLEICNQFGKTFIKLFDKPFNELKKVYVYQNRFADPMTLARELNLDLTTVYSWLRGAGVPRGKRKISTE